MNQQYYRPGGFRILPPVVKNLLIINGLFFLATLSLGQAFNIDLNDILGLHYFASEKFNPIQLVTYMFLHGDLMHILFNMFALWMFGKTLEEVWGSKRFLTYYMITGMGAAVFHYLIYWYEISPVLHQIDAFLDNPSIPAFVEFQRSDFFQVSSYDIMNNFNEFRMKYNAIVHTNPTEALQMAIDFTHQYRIDFLNAPVIVGASGAVFGLLLAFGMMFPNALIYVYFAIPIKAKWFVIIYGALELYSGFSNSQSNIAHFAHLGGMIFGYFLIIYWKKKRQL